MVSVSNTLGQYCCGQSSRVFCCVKTLQSFRWYLQSTYKIPGIRKVKTITTKTICNAQMALQYIQINTKCSINVANLDHWQIQISS